MRCRRWCPRATCPSCSSRSARCAPQLPRGVPLIGFAGAPFTLLCYLVCGKPSKEFGPARAFLYAQPAVRRSACSRTWPTPWPSTCARRRPRAPRRSCCSSRGRDCWRRREFTRFALAAVRRTAAALRATGVPLIYYVNQGSALMHGGGGSRCGRDRRRLAHPPGRRCARSSDPARPCRAISIRRRCLPRRRSCGATWTAVLEQAGPAAGHIFNLGHGIWPDTDPDAVARLIDYVHEHR